MQQEDRPGDTTLQIIDGYSTAQIFARLCASIRVHGTVQALTFPLCWMDELDQTSPHHGHFLPIQMHGEDRIRVDENKLELASRMCRGPRGD